MPGTTQSAPPRVIVIPRQLEEFFYERLSAEFADRDDVVLVVDRRVGERRRSDADGRSAGRPGERRQGERRTHAPAWSLPDMPFSLS